MKKYTKIQNKKNIKNFSILFCFLFLSFLFFNSCEKETNTTIGENFISESEKLNFDSTNIKVNITSQKIDSVINSYYYTPLGSLNDNVFGTSIASIAFQLKPAVFNIDFSKFDSIASLNLHFHLVSRYGDSLQTQTVNIYQLKTALDNTKAYYSNTQVPEITSLSLIAENTEIKTDSAENLLIELPREFANSLTINSDSINYSNTEEFLNFFKGFYIRPNTTGIGCVNTLSFIANDSKMILEYYSEGEKNTLEFIFDSETIVASMLEHDYSNASTELQNAIADNNFNEYSFVQGLAGIETKITIPKIDSVLENKNVVINRAILTIYARNYTDITEFPAPPQLYMVKLNSSNEQTLVRDLLAGSTAVYDGKYNSSKNCYKFNITAEIQSMLLNKTNYELYLIPSPDRNAGFPHRISLWGNTNDENQATLKLYYSYK